jgi:hypothetical protein
MNRILLLFCLLFSGSLCAQCPNSSVSVKRTANESQKPKGGTIDISVNTSGAYICVLSIQKGSGPEKIMEKKGSGNSVVRFEKLDVSQIYKVEVEFLNEEEPFCRKLVQSLITIEK